MAGYAYTTVPGKIRVLFGKIRQAGRPKTANTRWLTALGFTSSNDRSLLHVLKQIGFVDEAGSPTKTWQEYRGARHGAVLAEAVRNGYRELFQHSPDAQSRTPQELSAFFASQSSAGEQAINKTVSTFVRLCELAEFNDSTTTPVSPAEAVAVDTSAQSRTSVGVRIPELHIDIHIHIAADATPEQIDHVFASMARHLSSADEG